MSNRLEPNTFPVMVLLSTKRVKKIVGPFSSDAIPYFPVVPKRFASLSYSDNPCM